MKQIVTQQHIKTFVSCEYRRKAMQGVHYNKERDIFEASDGIKLVEWKDQDLSKDICKDCILPLSAFPDKKTDRRVIKVRGDYVHITIFEPYKKGEKDDFKPTVLNRSILPLTTGCEYPKTAAIWLIGEQEKISRVNLSVKHLSGFNAFSCINRGEPGIALKFYGQYKPVIVEPQHNSGVQWRGLIMPQRDSVDCFM